MKSQPISLCVSGQSLTYLYQGVYRAVSKGRTGLVPPVCLVHPSEKYAYQPVTILLGF